MDSHIYAWKYKHTTNGFVGMTSYYDLPQKKYIGLKFG